ncbi:MAG: B12-binding domain-containing radical SAM protein [Promethearchaeota archaeon]
MGLRILLINPNRMHNPPVIPIGLEYLTNSLEKQGHNVKILDLCFSSTPVQDIEKTLRKDRFDMVGFTIRNIDSCIYFNNEYYLPEFKKLIDCVKQHEVPIILGGAGFSAMPDEILDYLQADYGIIGPGERAFPKFLESWQAGKIEKTIFNGWNYGLDDNKTHTRAKKVNYQKYFTNDGIAGFSTHIGCQNHCPYCIEAGTKVSFKKISNIIKEIESLVNLGYTHFHLCDSEFNTDLNFSIDFCSALAKKSFPLKWTLYMKPYPYNERLFQVLNESNAYLVTLSVDSDKIIQALNNYSYADLANIIGYCNKYKIELAIDLLSGYPYETLDSTKEMLGFFKKNRPKTVGISFYYRIYLNTPLEKSIRNDPTLQKNLTRRYSKKENYLQPIFFSQYEQKDLEELIAGDDLFRIAGIKPGVNYQL